jgi:hypothetical protein
VSAAAGNAAEASRHRAEAVRIVNEIQKEAATASIQKRADLTAILAGNVAAP